MDCAGSGASKRWAHLPIAGRQVRPLLRREKKCQANTVSGTRLAGLHPREVLSGGVGEWVWAKALKSGEPGGTRTRDPLLKRHWGRSSIAMPSTACCPASDFSSSQIIAFSIMHDREIVKILQKKFSFFLGCRPMTPFPTRRVVLSG